MMWETLAARGTGRHNGGEEALAAMRARATRLDVWPDRYYYSYLYIAR
jgi:hypothetical protein